MSESKIKLLVPVAFSPQSNIIVEQACNLAKYYGANLTLIYVLDTSRTKGLFSKMEEDKARDNAQAKLDEYVKVILQNYQLEIDAEVIEGRISETIVTEATKRQADLIIMGATGATGLKSQFVGSNTMKTIKRAPCPVITIRGTNHRVGCKNIVLPLDLTKDTTQKLEFAVDMAKMFGDSIVRIVSVIWTNERKVIQPLTKQIIKAQEYVQTAGIECTAEFVKIIKSEDSFSQTIIDYAEKVEGDVIMIMTQQETNPTELFIGSSAQSIISKSNIPVMSISPRGANSIEIF